MNKTKIGWTDVSWNPVHGCTRVSDGCRLCYAERLSLRQGWTKKPWTVQNERENVMLKPHKLREPYKLKEPSRVFVNSMSDLFHPLIPDDYRRQVFQVMRDCPQHTFQVLTKRPALAAAWPAEEWTPNIWMGVSVEDERVIGRVEELRQCPAHVRFISAEPLIGPWPYHVDLSGYQWLIVGGESGPGFRPMPHGWARHIRDLCQLHNVAFFFKQSAAYRTEMGTALRDKDGSFWAWQQFPDDQIEGGYFENPQPAQSHKYTYENGLT